MNAWELTITPAAPDRCSTLGCRRGVACREEGEGGREGQ
jgi:hypothetical protein